MVARRGAQDRRRRAQDRAETWPVAGAAGPRRATWPAGLDEFLRQTAARMADWAATEVAPGRLFPWLPVAFGGGIVFYFTADHEPIWPATVALALVFVIAAVRARRSAVA